MKRILLFILSAIGIVNMSAQDEQKSIDIKLNDINPTSVEYRACTLSVLAMQQGESEVTLSIDVENNSEAQYIFLFGQAYPEKVLKKNKPSICFDKHFPGNDNRNIQTCDGLNGNGYLQINANSSRTITMQRPKGEIIRCEIPLYVAITKNYKKYYIEQRVKVTLNMRLIEDKPDPSIFEGIKRKYDVLLEEIEKVVVCPDKNHNPSITDQKKPYLDRIEELKNEIADIKRNNHWRDSDEAYQPFKEIISGLDDMVIKEEICEMHLRTPIPPVPIHRHCSYCDVTPEGLLKDMTKVYQNLDAVKITKKKAVSEAERYHKAYTSGCPNLKTKVSGSSLKSKIDSYYRSIIEY